jgi:formyltetrahydrofolate synthetase
MSLKDKIEKICKEMYGADGVDYSELAETRLAVSPLAAAYWPLRHMLY